MSSLVFCCLLIMLIWLKCVPGGLAAVTTTSTNVTATVGDSVSFTCTTNTSRQIRWTHSDTTKTVPTLLFIGTKKSSNCSTRYSIIIGADNETSTLTISALELSDAGVITCMEHIADVAGALSFYLAVSIRHDVTSSNENPLSLSSTKDSATGSQSVVYIVIIISLSVFAASLCVALAGFGLHYRTKAAVRLYDHTQLVSEPASPAVHNSNDSVLCRQDSGFGQMYTLVIKQKADTETVAQRDGNGYVYDDVGVQPAVPACSVYDYAKASDLPREFGEDDGTESSHYTEIR